MEEKQLIEKAKSGDKMAIELLYRSTFTYIFKYVRGSINDLHTTEDVVSNIYVNAFSKLNSFRGESSFKTWLHMIARNEIYQQYKRNSVSRKFINIDENFLEYSDPIAETENDLQSDEKKQLQRHLQEVDSDKRVEIMLSKMNSRYADVLRLRFILGMTIRECAEILNITENNVKVLQNRALKSAGNLLNNEYGKSN